MYFVYLKMQLSFAYIAEKSESSRKLKSHNHSPFAHGLERLCWNAYFGYYQGLGKGFFRVHSEEC